MTARIRIFLVLLLASTGALAAPARGDSSTWLPDRIFAQAGTDSTTTSAYALGAVWDWQWQRKYSLGAATGYTEGTIGQWQTDDAARGGPRSYTQIGVTPVLRFFPGNGNDRWFAEFGLGVNYITPVYQGYGKSFSTEINFGDHVALGSLLGSQRLASIALRLQHFSNAGLSAPNPGENFVQLRYTYEFKTH